METFMLVLLIGVVALYVGYPYFTKMVNNLEFENDVAEVPIKLTEARDVALETLKDIQLDHEMGKLSDQDYRVMNDQYRSQAIQLLKEIKAYQVEGREGTTAVEDPMSRDQEQTKPDQVKYCSYCGVALPPWGRYCHQCGHQVFRA